MLGPNGQRRGPVPAEKPEGGIGKMNDALRDRSRALVHYAGMKHIIMLASIAALASTAPAYAKPKHGHHGNHYAQANCPPGLAKKNNGCQPPGQAKKLYNVGQRLPYGYNGYTPYNQLPYDLRNRYSLNDDYRYIYRDNYLYQVDPRTNLVSQVLSAILR